MLAWGGGIAKTGSMYRDASDHVDEHDRAAGAILMAEALLAACDEAVALISAPATPDAERWRAVMQLHDTFPDVWRDLDKARGLLAMRGANTIAYDELAPSVRRKACVDRVHGLDKAVVFDASHLDRAALSDAHRGIAQLKLALPSADWAAIEARTRGLAAAELKQHRRPRLVVGITVGAIAAAVLGFGLMPAPAHAHRTPHAVALKQQLDTITAERHTKIADLRPQVVAVCDPPKARTYTQLLVMDGRGADAAAFSDDYAERCGADPVVENWANAPLPAALKNGFYVIDFPALNVSAEGPVSEAFTAPLLPAMH